jgi:hypothetical protein
MKKRTIMRRRAFVWFMCVMLSIPLLAEAHVTELVIKEKESPTFEGLAFGSVGQYERLVGYARGELDPTDLLNAGIVNIDRAPRNARGCVEYEADVFILKPVDLEKGNARLFYDVLNRGNKTADMTINNGPTYGPEGNNPRLAKDAGDGFLMKEGYTIVWSGWQLSYPYPGSTNARNDATGDRMSARFPVATEEDGSPIIGLSREEFIDGGNQSSFVGNLGYPTADNHPALSTLTVRQKETYPRQTPKDMTWRYLSDWKIEITRPAGYDGGAIYEFIYPAKDPVVYGIAFAAVRDVVSYLRYGTSDDEGNPNPLAPKGTPGVEKVLTHGRSQCGRFLRDMIYQGFNQNEKGRIVFDGVMALVAGSRKSFCNFEFAQPGRWSRQHEDHLQPGDQFPFTYGVLTDPISGRTDSILAKCRKSDTCPKIMQIDTDTEFWQGRASLVLTDTKGADITLPDSVRYYLLGSAQHAPAGTTDRSFRRYLSNPLDYRPFTRALIVALDKWITDGTEPPASRYPKRADGTLVPPDQVKFPKIPGVVYNGVVNGLRLTDYSVQPPAEGRAYPVLVPQVDSVGNTLAGVLHPFIEVPTATHTGWNLRASGHAENELGDGYGSYIPFAQTRAERTASGDPRPSIEERYSNHDAYVSKVAEVVDRLVQERFLLEWDAHRIKKAAAVSSIGKPQK